MLIHCPKIISCLTGISVALRISTPSGSGPGISLPFLIVFQLIPSLKYSNLYTSGLGFSDLITTE